MITSRQLAQFFNGLETQGYSATQVFEAFNLLQQKYHLGIDNHRLLSYLQKLDQQKQSESSLQIVSSHQVESGDVWDNVARLVKAGKSTPIKVTVESDLLGGFVAKYQGFLYDASFRHQLRRLHQQLLN